MCAGFLQSNARTPNYSSIDFAHLLGLETYQTEMTTCYLTNGITPIDKIR